MTKKALDKEVRASVIIPVWNGREYLPDCLSAVLSQDYSELEAIAVDNGSTDGSARFVAENYPDVRLIRSEYNLGFAGGCNLGLRAARGDILVLLNQDTRVHSGWLEALSAALQDSEVGVAGCKILYPDGETIQHAGGWIEWPLALAYHCGKGDQDAGQWDKPREVEYVTGAAMGFRRDILKEVGFLDEEFWPGYFEDADLCLQVRQQGYKIWYTPEAVLTHVESGSHSSHVRMWEAHHRGRLRLVLKHMTPEEFLTRFVEAEEDHQPVAVERFGSRPLRMAYLEAISRTPSILQRCWEAEEETALQVVRALQHLHSSAWEIQRQADRSIAVEAHSTASPVTLNDDASEEAGSVPQLKELEFQSSVPVFGPLVRWFRNRWYAVAAKWGIRYLMQQQEAINRHFTLRQKALEDVSEENALLAREIANLTLQLQKQTKAGRSTAVNADQASQGEGC